mgnify:CR=1 FL=1
MTEKQIPKAPLVLAKKMLLITKEVEYLQKDGVNAFHKYPYITASKIDKVLRGKFIEHNIWYTTGWEMYSHIEGMMILKGWCQYMCADTGQTIQMPWVAQGYDKGDKGLYKAYTGAVKYNLMKTFLIPTGDDPERWSPELEEEAKLIKKPKKAIKPQKLEDII